MLWGPTATEFKNKALKAILIPKVRHQLEVSTVINEPLNIRTNTQRRRMSVKSESHLH